MNGLKISCLALFGAAGLLLLPASSQAATRFFHPTACGAAASTNNNTQFSSVNPTDFFNPSTGQYGNGTQFQILFYCPLIADPTVTLPSGFNNSHPVNVSMFSNGSGTSSQTYAKACRVFAAGGGQGQSCSGVALPNGGPGVNQIPVQVLSGPSTDYYYLIVSFGPMNGSLSQNTFFGYSINN